MRKTLPIIAFLLSVALQICAQQKNYDFKEGKLFYKITDATKQYVQVTTEMDELVEATGTLYNNPIEGDITIPANINHQGKQYTVTGIADNSFGGCNKVTSVSIPASVTEFGEQVFLSCTGMKYITVDKDNSVLKDIDGVLFDKNGDKLIAYPNMRAANYDIPEGTVEIGAASFFMCNKIKTINFPSTLKKIGMLAFGHCIKMHEVTVPDNITDLGDFSFYNCTGLEKATIKANITELKRYMFSRCTALKNVVLPSTIEVIQTWAFGSCAAIKNIKLPDNLKGIEAEAFNGCETLSEITLPASLEQIGMYTFDGCKQLKSITCLRNTPLTGAAMGAGVFESVDKVVCELKVPKGHRDEYAEAEQWRDFTRISEHDLSGISTIISQGSKTQTTIFTINGQRLPNNIQPSHGIYIVNGKKVCVK